MPVCMHACMHALHAGLSQGRLEFSRLLSSRLGLPALASSSRRYGPRQGGRLSGFPSFRFLFCPALLLFVSLFLFFSFSFFGLMIDCLFTFSLWLELKIKDRWSKRTLRSENVRYDKKERVSQRAFLADNYGKERPAKPLWRKKREEEEEEEEEKKKKKCSGFLCFFLSCVREWADGCF